MGGIEELIVGLSSQIGQFSMTEFILSKVLDIGTGKLWDEIKKKLSLRSLEGQLYDAIEASVKEFAKKYDAEQIAPACEIIYGRWVKNGYLSADDVKEALSNLNSRYISTRNIDMWFALFHREICDESRDILYRWFMLVVTQKSDEACRKRDVQIQQKLNKLLSAVESDKKTAIDEVRRKNKEALVNLIHQSILGEQFCLKDIYISLQGKIIETGDSYNVTAMKKRVVDTTSFLWDWYARESEDLLFIHGTPGSGKSSLVKMLAASISAETDGLVVFIDLFRLHFSDKMDAFEVVKQYIKENYMWFFDESIPGKRLLILDGLDEIRYKPYDNAAELFRGVCEVDWRIKCSIILSGRTQIVDFLTDIIGCSELELLPLFFRECLQYVTIEKQNLKQEYMEEDLRKLYWDKLLTAFDVKLEFPMVDEQFDELSDSPLLLFMVVWTLAHAEVEFKDLNSIVDLYDAIFQHIYTRAYNRISAHDSRNFNKEEYMGYQQMLKYLGGTAFIYNGRAISAKEIYEYCENMDAVGLCKEWIRTHKEDNPSKLVLLFFLREEQDKMNWEESEIEFIHKTFYEYLAAQAVLELLFHCKSGNTEAVKMLFHLLSHNLLGGMVLDFITEIMELGNRKIGEETVTDETVGEHLIYILHFCYGRNNKSDSNKKLMDSIMARYKVPYSELKAQMEKFEGNIRRLLQLITEKEHGYRMDLSRLDFSEKYMPHWIFTHANMNTCVMTNSCLTSAVFKKCKLKGAKMISIIADQTDFSYTNLTEADFSGATLAVAKFSSALCQKTQFRRAVMEGAHFKNCKLIDVDFMHACLVATSFTNVTLVNVNFRYADLSGATFTNVIIEGGFWDGCILKDVKLEGVKLVQFNLNNPEIIEMLCEASLERADWSGVTKEQRKLLLGAEKSNVKEK